jgi:hypothetical protein
MLEMIGIYESYRNSNRSTDLISFFENCFINEIDKMNKESDGKNGIQRLCKYWCKGQHFVIKNFRSRNNKKISRRVLRRLSYAFINKPIRIVSIADEVVMFIVNFFINHQDAFLKDIFINRLHSICKIKGNKTRYLVQNCEAGILSGYKDVLDYYVDKGTPPKYSEICIHIVNELDKLFIFLRGSCGGG